jgi:hypothetical protein
MTARTGQLNQENRDGRTTAVEKISGTGHPAKTGQPGWNNHAN